MFPYHCHTEEPVSAPPGDLDDYIFAEIDYRVSER